MSFRGLNDQHEMVIRTVVGRTTDPGSQQPGVFSIRNLNLVADWETQPTRDIYIDVMVGNRYGNAGALPPAAVNSNNLTTRQEAIRQWIADWRNPLAGSNVNILVARHVNHLLTLTAEGDLPELRSGYAIGVGPALANGGPRPLVETLANWTATPAFNGATGLTTGRTAVVRIQENVVNALDVSRTRGITFEVPEGVIITGLEWRYFEGSTPTGTHLEQWSRQFPNRTIVGQPAWATGRGYIVPRPALDQAQHGNNQNVIFVDDQTVTLRPDLSLHQRGAGRYNTLALEVRFFVSVAFGYELNVSDELEVTVTGLGVSNLDPSENTVAVATVYDPVVIEHEGDPVRVDLVGREQNVYHLPAGAVTITETDGAMLQRGTRLWLEVVRYYAPDNFPLVLSRGDVITDPGSNLGLTVVRVENPTVGGAATTRFLLEVTRESTEGNPGSITVDGLTLFGHVYQGERYFIIVSGPAIAENHFGVVNNSVSPMERGVFVDPPFAKEIIDFSAAADGNRALSLDGVVFNPTTAIGGVQPPIIWRRLPGMAHEAGFVAARSFAVLAGVTDENINWASGVATISGWNYQGQWVTVILTQNSTTATVVVDGTVGTVDIAEYAEGQSGPAGTVAPIFYQNRIYLPFRFLFNAFGYSTDYSLARVGNTAVVSAR
jgi:hypothetical protein